MPEGRSIPVSRTFPIQLTHGHNFPAHQIRQLICDSLTPIPTDPVPKSIFIRNIVINQVDNTNLEITCEVYFAI